MFTKDELEIKFFTKNKNKLDSHKIKKHGITPEEVYLLYYGVTPKKCYCGKNTQFLSFTQGYREFCSAYCSAHSVKVLEKKKLKNKEKFGVEWYSKSDICKEKMKSTNMEKYGVEYALQSDICKEKMKSTNMEKYGVEYTGAIKSSRVKYKKTCIEKYGVDNVSKTDEVKAKIKESFNIIYGYDNVSQHPEMKKKIAIALSDSYNKNKIRDDFKGFVYIAHFENVDSVKIGISFNPIRRLNSIKKWFGDYKIIKIIHSDNVYKLESELHEKFKEFRVVFPEGDGRTEFFKSNIINLLEG